jgi:hypothetical protein
MMGRVLLIDVGELGRRRLVKDDERMDGWMEEEEERDNWEEGKGGEAAI